jgi:gliding motility-associated-like protein
MQKYIWESALGEFLSEDSIYRLELPGIIRLKVYNADGCSSEDELRIRKAECPEIFVPDAFSPNGDGQSDVWKFFGSNIAELSVRVFNAWGEVVFAGNGRDAFWDGKFRGIDCPPGAYQYVIQYSGITSENESFSEGISGQVYLIR